MRCLIWGFILACALASATSLHCHMCQTLEAESCNDPYTNDDLDHCEDDHYCVKYKTIVTIRDSGYINGWKRDSYVVTRTCQPKAGHEEGCIGWQNNGGITIKCWCGTDGCNDAGSVQSSLLVPFIGSFIAVVYSALSR